MVNSIEDSSLVGEWNKKLQLTGDSDRAIRPYDRLVSFNHKEAPPKGKEVMDMLRDTIGPVSILVQRPAIQKVMVKKTVPQLGISHIDGLTFLLLTNITDGVFKVHNSVAPPEEEVRIPTRIVSVNGKKGEGSMLLTWMQEAEGSFEIEMLHYD